MQSFKHWRLSVVILLVAILAVAVGVAGANPPPKPVSGEFIVQSFPCDQGVGLCSAGQATGDLSGDVFVVITSSSPSADGTLNNYTGTITITRNNGTLSGTIAGSVTVPGGDLNSTVNFTDGTKKYRVRTGTLNVTGFFDFATGAERDQYNGSIQVNPGR